MCCSNKLKNGRARPSEQWNKQQSYGSLYNVKLMRDRVQKTSLLLLSKKLRKLCCCNNQFKSLHGRKMLLLERYRSWIGTCLRCKRSCRKLQGRVKLLSRWQGRTKSCRKSFRLPGSRLSPSNDRLLNKVGKRRNWKGC